MRTELKDDLRLVFPRKFKILCTDSKIVQNDNWEKILMKSLLCANKISVCYL